MGKDRPRFHPRVVIPEVPDGMFLAKFHGEPVLLPEKRPNEPLVGQTGFTQRQIEMLVDLEIRRREITVNLGII